MEYIVGLLAFFICFCFLLRQTENTVFALSVNTLICSLFIGMMWPIAIEQSRSEIAQWLADRSLITDLSILLMADILMQIAYTILAVRELYGVKERRWERRIRIFLRAFPGLLLFPVVFFLLVWSIFSLPGYSFSVLAWVLAAILLLVIPAGSLFLRWLLPARNMRLDFLFQISCLETVLGMLLAVGNQFEVSEANEINYSSLWGVLLLTGAMTLFGFGCDCVMRALKKHLHKIRDSSQVIK